MIVYIKETNANKLKEKLEILINKINNYYTMWNLKINPSKCETIIFRNPTRQLAATKKRGLNTLEINTHNLETKEITPIQTKKIVKYLGMNIDYLARNVSHIDIQLQKAKNKFKLLGRLFYNKNISPKAKVICYMLLIRPLMTYAAPIWWNISAGQMEKMRLLERSCLRAALNKYRSAQTEYRKWINNKEIYNEAGIPRIDNHIIKLARDYYSRCAKSKNAIIKSFATIDERKMSIAIEEGYPQPKAFILLDKRGIIQDGNNKPIIYHWRRHKKDKKLPSTWEKVEAKQNPYKYSMAISEVDYQDKHRLLHQYWWLNDGNAKHIQKLKNRLQRK